VDQRRPHDRDRGDPVGSDPRQRCLRAGTRRVLRRPLDLREDRRTTVGGVEIIGVDGQAYRSTFYDSFGNVHRSRLEIEGDMLRWIGDRTRCTVTAIDGGVTQVAHHESSADGVSWTPSMDVTLRKVA
jgi:hypothetical protein